MMKSQKERRGLDLRGADLCQVDLHHLPLGRLRGGLMGSEWGNATVEQRSIAAVLLKGSRLNLTHLEGAILRKAHLEGAVLFRTHLERAHLDEANLENTSLREIYLEKATLGKITLGDKQGVGPRVVDAHFNDSNLAVVKWSQVEMLGDEYIAKQRKRDGEVKDHVKRLEEYEVAVRANRQLAVALQSQGLNEDASRFDYRAQKLQRIVLRMQKKFGQYLFSGFLDLLAGYGYRPGRSLIWYLGAIFGFAFAYVALGHLPFLPDAFVFSLTSFHGRGFFPGLGSEASLHNPLVIFAALEAVVGLFIEISFIATFTQRFFGK